MNAEELVDRFAVVVELEVIVVVLSEREYTRLRPPPGGIGSSFDPEAGMDSGTTGPEATFFETSVIELLRV